MSSTSTATLPLPAATPHLRAVRSVPSSVDRRHGGPVPQRPAAAGQPGSAPQGSAQSGFGQPGFGPSGFAASGSARVAAAAVPSVSPVPPVAPQIVPALPPQALLAALPEGAAVVAALPQGSLPQALLAQYGAQFGASAGQPMVGYLVLVPAEGGGVAVAPGVGQQGFPTASIPAPQAGPTAAVGASVLGAPGAAGLGAAGAGATAGTRPVRPVGRGITVDTERRNAYVDGQLLDLTYLEFELLAHLTEHPQRVHTRDHLVSAVWGYGHVGDGRTVDVHVARLRRKLGAAYRDSIVTVRRVGYKYTPAA
ncbi:winged helix-turn-helix domain-containing protein [Kitasatospora purpeofusca]|uniref:winged helix-turn-helix domain-containing protein n=1 Tax=Kitasatospora purpeofusca TaxID=67352 RepID=UPI003684281C